MILIEVYFPLLNRSYDFELDENSSVSQTAEEMISMISVREHCTPPEHKERYELFDVRERRRIAREKTFAEEGICSGQRLILC